MARNRVQNGMVIQFLNDVISADIASGDIVVVGNMIGVALVDIADDAIGSVAITEVYNLLGVTSAAFVVGDRVGFDVSLGLVDDDAFTGVTGDILTFGVAFETKTTAAGESVAILLTPGTGTIVA